MWVIKNQKNHMIHHILSCKATSPVHHLSKDHTLSKRRKIGMFKCHLIMSKSNGSPLSKSTILRSLHCNLRSTVVGGLASDPCHGLLKLIVALQIIFKNSTCYAFVSLAHTEMQTPYLTIHYPSLQCSFVLNLCHVHTSSEKGLWFYGLEPTIRMVHGHLWR